MTRRSSLIVAALVAVTGALVWNARLAGAPPPKGILLERLGGYAALDGAGNRLYDEGAVEISAYDPATRRVFLTFAEREYLEVLDFSNPAAPSKLFEIPLGPGRYATSVDVRDGILAVALPAATKTDPGQAVFYDVNGTFLSAVTVGALPDMITFTPNGDMALTANEGEPDNGYTIDPEGSISIIDLRGGVASLTDADVTDAGFTAFNGAVLDPSIRIFGPGATVAQDLEPEYIAVSHDSRTAWVTLQENNALAIVDLKSKTVTDLVGLGYKNHDLPGNGLDANRNDDQALIQNWPVFGMYMPDAIASFTIGPHTYLVTANEGDAREYDGLNAPKSEDANEEPVRLEDVVLDPAAFPPAIASLLQDDDNGPGDLNITSMSGDLGGDGDYDVLYSFGARSFSILAADGSMVYDSGDDLEQLTAATYPDHFNASNSGNSIDNRSDDKGPEPEGVTHAKLFGRDYVFVLLERIGGVVVVDVSNPSTPIILQYINWRDLTIDPDDAAEEGEETGDWTTLANAGDLGPEGARVIQAEDSPTGEPLLIVSNEVSGTLGVFRIVQDK